MSDNQNTHIIEQAAALLGSKSELARQLGVRPQSVRKWVRYDRIPAEQCCCLLDDMCVLVIAHGVLDCLPADTIDDSGTGRNPWLHIDFL